jgi:amino acid transporter
MLRATHPQHRSPHVAIVAQSVVTVALAASGTFEQLALLANISVLALDFGCTVAAWRLHSTDASQAPSLVMRVAPVLACAVIAWLQTGVTRGEWLAFGLCVGAATVIDLATRALHR